MAKTKVRQKKPRPARNGQAVPAPAIRDRIIDFRRVPASDLLPSPRNWRTHSESQRKALQGVLDEIGYADALLARELPDGRLELVDGHLRKDVTPNQVVPVLVLDLTEEETGKVLLTLDPLAAMASADKDALEALLRSVQTGSEAVAEMLAGLAQENGIIPGLNGQAPPEDPGPQVDRAAELQAKWKTASGQLWTIPSKTVPGKAHRLLCGDSAKAEDVGRVMGGEKADAVISDPPYGIDFDTDYRRFTGGCGPGTNHAPIANDDKPFDPTPWLEFPAVVLWGANCYSSKLPLGTWLVWDKRFKNGTAMLSDAEVAWMKTGHGVYLFAETSQGFVRPEPVQHPTQKPVSVMRWCMEKSKAGPVVLDPYLGSGTTLVAAEQTGRIAYGVEISPAYCAVAIERLSGLGLSPELT